MRRMKFGTVMKTLLKAVALVGLFATVVCSSFASSLLDERDALCVKTPDKLVEFSKIDLVAVNKNFEHLASLKGVDIEALRGDYFVPREFWQQPRGDVFAALYPTLMKHNIPHILSCKHRSGCIVSSKNRPILRPLPIGVEVDFEKSVLERINAFLEKKKQPLIGSEEFLASLLFGRKKGDITNDGSRVPATPLLTYFEAHYRFKVDGFCGSVEAELLTEP